MLYAGIPIGKVRDIRLDESGLLRVKVKLAIREGVAIRKDAKFVINQSGLLGDRYVDVIPQGTTKDVLQSGAEVEGTVSVDLSEAVRSVVDVLHQAAGTIERIDKAIKRVDESVLSTQSLAHVTATLANVDTTTSNAVALTLSLREVVEDNRDHVGAALAKLSEASENFTEASANVTAASENISAASERVNDLLKNNQDDIRATIQNLSDSSKKIDAILTRLDNGEGTAGKLLTDPTLHDELLKLVQNLRRYGLLYKENERKPGAAEPPRGKTPVPVRPSYKPADGSQ